MKEGIIRKIKEYQAVVGIVGLGYVGLPLMLRFTEVGFPVLGFDCWALTSMKLKWPSSTMERAISAIFHQQPLLRSGSRRCS
jgi:UDP-N-acetyl-D-glucosamine dehydrogenase